MARRKGPAVPVEFTSGEPPEDLLRFVPTTPGRWSAADFAAFLRARVAWRDTHREPLPSLPARERLAMVNIPGVPRALIDEEEVGSKGAPPPPCKPQGQVVDRPAPVAWSHPDPEGMRPSNG